MTFTPVFFRLFTVIKLMPLTVLGLTVAILLANVQEAHAFRLWPWGKKKVEVTAPAEPKRSADSPFLSPEETGYYPPSKTQLTGKEEGECGRLKDEVRAINSKPFTTRTAMRPKRAMIRSKHYDCMTSFHDQEKAYLENNILLPPSADTVRKPTFDDLDMMNGEVPAGYAGATGASSTSHQQQEKNSTERFLRNSGNGW